MNDEINEKIEGVGRIPRFDPDVMLEVVKQKFPKINGWFIQFADVATTMLDACDHGLVGHDEPYRCQLKVLGHGPACDRESDFLLINLVLVEGPDGGPTVNNSRVRYYCGPCVYTTMTRAISVMSKADKLHAGGALEEGIEEWSFRVMDERADFVESAIGRSAEVLENKYTCDGDEIIDKMREAFESGQ